jgi:hypothetical protein
LFSVLLVLVFLWVFLDFLGKWFPSLFPLPITPLVLCNYVLDRLVGGFSHLVSFPWFNFILWVCWVLG